MSVESESSCTTSDSTDAAPVVIEHTTADGAAVDEAVMDEALDKMMAGSGHEDENDNSEHESKPKPAGKSKKKAQRVKGDQPKPKAKPKPKSASSVRTAVPVTKKKKSKKADIDKTTSKTKAKKRKHEAVEQRNKPADHETKILSVKKKTTKPKSKKQKTAVVPVPKLLNETNEKEGIERLRSALMWVYRSDHIMVDQMDAASPEMLAKTLMRVLRTMLGDSVVESLAQKAGVRRTVTNHHGRQGHMTMSQIAKEQVRVAALAMVNVFVTNSYKNALETKHKSISDDQFSHYLEDLKPIFHQDSKANYLFQSEGMLEKVASGADADADVGENVDEEEEEEEEKEDAKPAAPAAASDAASDVVAT